MIRPGRHDITIPQRATFREPLRLKANGEPVDLTGYDARAQIWDRRRTVQYAELVIDWIDREQGRLDLVLNPPETTNVSVDAYWDLLITEPGGERYYWLEGRAYVDPGLTDDPPEPTP
jgi:hypothetical protein